MVVVIILVAVIVPQAIRILREYERGVIFRLGKLRQGAWFDSPHPGRRSDGEDGPAGGNHRCLQARDHDPRQCARNARRSGLFPGCGPDRRQGFWCVSLLFSTIAGMARFSKPGRRITFWAS
jgi:hypothetical protein